MGRETTVLFAGVTDAGALDSLGTCFEKLKAATRAAGGRVIKTIGEDLMAVFPTPDAAAIAAGAMQKAIDALGEASTTRPGVRIGFHTGPVLQREDDIFGDTVNVAARLARQAIREQILTSATTAAALSEPYRACLRELYAVELKGKADEVGLFEFVWRIGNDTDRFDTVMRGMQSRTRPVQLRLVHNGEEIARRRESDSFTIGREPDCDLVIVHHLVSRRHCSILRRGDKFVLADQSSNGTFVTIEGDSEFLLQREEFILRRRGTISFGQPREGSEHFIEFSLD